MTSQVGKVVIGLVTLMSVVAGIPTGAASSQAPAPPPESMLKVDVLLVRHRVDPSGKTSAESETAARELARSEALFEKGLISRPQLDAARAKARDAQGPPVSRIPYTLFVQVLPSGTGRPTSMRVGVEVPGDAATATSKEGVTSTRREARYLGTNIDASAAALPEGRYRLSLTIQDSSAVPQDRWKEFSAVTRDFYPVVRTFSTSNHLVLRPGQASTFSVGTDPITGETMSAEVMVNLVK